MLTDLKIEQFKGVESGTISDLSDVNIFVGPNNAGKSTVLDSVYLLSSVFSLEDPLGNNIPDYIVSKKGGNPYGNALHYKYDSDTRIFFEFNLDSIDKSITTNFGNDYWEVGDSLYAIEGEIEETGEKTRKLYDETTIGEHDSLEELTKSGDVPNAFLQRYHAINNHLTNSLYFHSGIFEVLTQVEQEVWKSLVFDRSDKRVINHLNRVYDTDVDQLTFVPIGDGYELRVLFDDYSSRIDSLGDGFRYLFSLIASIESYNANTLLVEEPENAQHPKTYDTISNILTNYSIENGLQVFIATHSYEMIASLLESCENSDTGVSIYHLNLEDGALETRSIDAPDMEVLEDLGIDPRRLKEYE